MQQYNHDIAQLQKQLQLLEEEKKSKELTNTQYLNRVLEICDPSKSKSYDQKVDRLYQLKTHLQMELVTNMPLIGLQHKLSLHREAPHIKILRHKALREDLMKAELVLRSAADGFAKEVIQRTVQPDDQESLALSQSYNMSAVKKSKNYQERTNTLQFPQNSQNSQGQQQQQQQQQQQYQQQQQNLQLQHPTLTVSKPPENRKWKQSSAIDYGNYNDVEEKYDDD